jgi:hypothetical protein
MALLPARLIPAFLLLTILWTRAITTLLTRLITAFLIIVVTGTIAATWLTILSLWT